MSLDRNHKMNGSEWLARLFRSGVKSDGCPPQSGPFIVILFFKDHTPQYSHLSKYKNKTSEIPNIIFQYQVICTLSRHSARNS